METNTGPKPTEPISKENLFANDAWAVDPEETDRRVWGQKPEKDENIDLYISRFKDDDPYTPPPDASENPGALYEFPDGYGSLFPAKVLYRHESTSDSAIVATPVATPAQAEVIIKRLEEDDPYKDYAISNLALHYLYEENYQEANRLMDTIKDIGVATHVLTQIYKVEIEKAVISEAAEQKLRSDLRSNVDELSSELNIETYQAAIVEEAAKLLGDKALVALARTTAEGHFPTFTSPKSETTKMVTDSDGSKEVDMAELLR